MAATSMLSGSSRVYTHRPSHIRTYNWPPYQLNFWIFTMLLASSAIVGVCGEFIAIQNQMDLPVPWYFPYYITVGSLGLLFVATIFWLIFQRRLLPAIVMIGSFILFVLWLVGLVVIAIQLFGPSGSIQSICTSQIIGHGPTGPSIDTLAWLQQQNICQCWQLLFSMGLVGTLFLLWIMIMAYQVFVSS